MLLLKMSFDSFTSDMMLYMIKENMELQLENI